MHILFLTMSKFASLNNRGIYEDLMREFVRNGHNVYVVSPAEKRDGIKTHIAQSSEGFTLLRVRTGNLQKTNLLEKGIATLRISSQFKKAIKSSFGKVRFDLIMYTTPPITLVNVIKYYKKRDKAKTFLLLKDIFPQNAIDIGVLRKSGAKGVIYRYFRKQESELYRISEHIGCMSKANADYVLANNPSVINDKITIVPNSIEPIDVSLSESERASMRDRYGIPQDKIVFVYGGNLGRPQDIPYIIECLKTQADNEKAYFLIVGDGTEFEKLKAYVDEDNPHNVKLLKRLPRDDFDKMLAACDVGLIFLDYRFTIPNYPSRLLSYMQAGIPVLACTDRNTDVGQDIVTGGFGWKCESNNPQSFADIIAEVVDCDFKTMGQKARDYLVEKFNVSDAYSGITEELNK